MRQTAVLGVLAVAFGSAAFAADPQLLGMVMPNAKILAGVNAVNARISPFGQFIIAKVAALGPNPPKFIEATGFNPLQDVSEVLAATAADRSTPGGLLLVRGNFNVDAIVAAATANPKVQVQSYGGATLLSFTNRRNSGVQAIAFIGNSVAVSGNLANVEAAIDRNGAPAAIDPALAAQVSQLSATEDEWLVSSVSVGSLLPAKATASTGPVAQVLPVLKNVQSFSGGVQFGANVQVTGQALASDAQNATAIAAVAKLGVTFLSAMGGNNAQLNDLVQLLQGLQVAATGSAVNLSLTIPEPQLEALVNQLWKAQTAVGRAHSRPRRVPNGN